MVDNDRVLAWDIRSAKRTELFRLQPDVKAAALTDDGKTLWSCANPGPSEIICRSSKSVKSSRPGMWQADAGEINRVHPQTTVRRRAAVSEEWPIPGHIGRMIQIVYGTPQLPRKSWNCPMILMISVWAWTFRRTANGWLHQPTGVRPISTTGERGSQSDGLGMTATECSSLALRPMASRLSLWGINRCGFGTRRRGNWSGKSKMSTARFVSPDGMVMACADEDAMRLPDHHGSVNQLQFSPDGKYLFALCFRSVPRNRYDCHVRVWDVAKRTEVTTIRGRFSVISRMSLSPDGHTLALLGGDESKKSASWNC